MPHSPLHPHPLSDIFPDSLPTSPKISPVPSDIPRLRAAHSTAGYRDGISLSKESFLQPGFDEGYSLGAVFGLRVGYVLGILDGLCTTLGKSVPGGSNDDKLQRGDEQVRGDGMRIGSLFKEAQHDLSMEKIFGQEWFGEDGNWKYEVGVSGKLDRVCREDVTFEQVAEQHPIVQIWTRRVREEMLNLGLRDSLIEGEEWEIKRVEESVGPGRRVK